MWAWEARKHFVFIPTSSKTSVPTKPGSSEVQGCRTGPQEKVARQPHGTCTWVTEQRLCSSLGLFGWAGWSSKAADKQPGQGAYYSPRERAAHNSQGGFFRSCKGLISGKISSFFQLCQPKMTPSLHIYLSPHFSIHCIPE